VKVIDRLPSSLTPATETEVALSSSTVNGVTP